MISPSMALNVDLGQLESHGVMGLKEKSAKP